MCETHGTPLDGRQNVRDPAEYTQNARFGVFLAIFSPVADINDVGCAVFVRCSTNLGPEPSPSPARQAVSGTHDRRRR